MAQDHALDRLQAIIAARANSDPASSYTAKLLAKGTAHIAKKFGEEVVETVIAAMQADPNAIVMESADVLYHWLVLMQSLGVDPQAVYGELNRRHGTSGLDEKAARPKD